jgi:DNA-binding MarR family transcriptional regulator
LVQEGDFDLQNFLPYLLNIAAEEASIGFAAIYKDRYGMLRTEWRVLFHLGRYGEMTAKDICMRARLHKTKVSRAVTALEKRRFITRAEMPDDRRHVLLTLTDQGRRVYADLQKTAQSYEAELCTQFSKSELQVLRSALARLARV